MNRLSRHVGTFVLLFLMMLPTVLVVVATCVGASHVQQVVSSTPLPHRRHR